MSTVESLRAATECFSRRRLHPVAAEEHLVSLEGFLGKRIPESARFFLSRISNGAELNQFVLYPCAFETPDRNAVKWLWNSLQRNNDPEKSEWLRGDRDTLDAFFVFATDGYACFTLPYGDDDPYVWMLEAGEVEMVELDYRLDEWMVESARHDAFDGAS